MYRNPGSPKIQNSLCQLVYLVHSSDRYMMIQSYLPRCWSNVVNLCSLLCLCSNPNKSSHAVREVSRNKNLDCAQITKKKSIPRAVHYACLIPSTWKMGLIEQDFKLSLSKSPLVLFASWLEKNSTGFTCMYKNFEYSGCPFNNST